MAWTQSQADAEEQMGKNGDVIKKQFRITSTVRGMCTEGACVQESLWKLLDEVPVQALQLQVPIPTSPFHSLLSITAAPLLLPAIPHRILFSHQGVFFMMEVIKNLKPLCNFLHPCSGHCSNLVKFRNGKWLLLINN